MELSVGKVHKKAFNKHAYPFGQVSLVLVDASVR